jgi:exosortase
MMLSTPLEEAASPKASVWTARTILALVSSVAACVTLLAVVRYCATYGQDKATLFQLFLGTFDEQHPASLSGEATASEWSYCAFVPPIVAFVVWQLWPKLRRTPRREENAGFLILGAGLLVYLAGFRMENYYIGMAAMELVYAGLIVLFLGWKIMRVLLFPWAFLMFMWPYNFMEDVALQLRLLMSFLSHDALRLLGIPNILHGTAVFSLPGSARPFAVDIADPCSGIRSLFALLMVASVFAFFLFRQIWKQAVIIALAVPLVIAGNLVRIILLALATIHFGNDIALGTEKHPSWIHEGAGYLVYLVDLVGLVLSGLCLTRWGPRPQRHAHA